MKAYKMFPVLVILTVFFPSAESLLAQGRESRCESAKNKASCEAYFTKLDSGKYFPGSDAGDAYVAIREYMEEKCREPEDDMIFGRGACDLMVSHISSNKRQSSIAEKDWNGLAELMEQICLSKGSCTSCEKAAALLFTKPEYEKLSEVDLKKKIGGRVLALYNQGCIGGCDNSCASKKVLEEDRTPGTGLLP